jgi:hypothetical protein
VPLKRLCDPALSALRPSRAGQAVPRTSGRSSDSDDATSWPAAPFQPSVSPALPTALAARAAVRAVERFYTTVEQIRERVTAVWRDLTLMKEKRFAMISRSAAPRPLLLLPRRGVAGNRQIAVFCQSGPVRLPRYFGFDMCSRPAWLDGLRRFQD